MKYRRVIAALLAVSLILNTAPASVTTEASSKNTGTVAEYAEVSNEDASVNDTSDAPGDDGVNQDNGGETGTDQGNTEETPSEGDISEETPSETTPSEEESDTVATAVNGEFALADLKNANIDGLTVAADNTSVTVSSAAGLILLSHCNAAELQNLTIDIKITGIEVDLTKPAAGPGGQQYAYAGLGSEEAPFAGTITGQKPVIKVNRAVFGGLSSTASVIASQQIQWAGDGNSPMLADVYVMDGTDGTIPMTFTNGTGPIAGKIKGTGTFTVGDQITYRDNRDSVSVASNNHAGLICNTLESGSVQITDQFSFPSNGYSVTALAGNAGGLIGQMNTGTKLTISKSAELDGLTVTASAGNAGGLIGQMDENAEIITEKALTLKNPAVTGSSNAGGLIGLASNVLFAEGNKEIALTSPAVTATAGGTVGGMIGRYELSAKGEQKLPEYIVMTDPELQISQASNGVGYIGGYFGVLDLKNNTSYTIGNKKTAFQINVKMKHSPYVRAYGAVAGEVTGEVTGNGVLNAVYLKNLDITSVYCSGSDRGDARYHGGLIGELGVSGNENAAVYLEADNIVVNDNAPYVYNEKDPYTYTNLSAFGGVVGLSAKGCVSKIGKFKLNTGKAEISKGGGVAGFAEAGSAVELSGTTDLSEVRYAKYWSAGQIIGAQDSALIYAKGDGEGHGWTLERCPDTYASQNNDIGNYGEVIRLQADGTQAGLGADLIQIDAGTHKIQLKTPSDSNYLDGVDGAVIADTDDFALFAIAWQTHGAFPVAEVTTENYTSLQTQTITLNGDVDLTGTGITGVSRDSQQDAMIYSGTLNGQTHKIVLALGETYGLRGGAAVKEGEEGGGKFYPYKWGSYYNHTDIGLFAQTRGGVNNLTLSGKIALSNAADYGSVGGYAAKARGSMTLSGVTMEEKITIDAPNAKRIYAGGIFGDAVTGDGNIEITIQGDSQIKPDITIQKLTANTDSYINAGSVIGYAAYNFHKIACNGLTVGGTIRVDGDSYNYAYVGGLIARTARSGLAWIEIRSLAYDGFKIEAPNAKKVCGGLFGSVWSNVGVYFMGLNNNTDGVYTGTKLTVKDAVINAPNASVGGLAYRSSGIWEIRKKGIDMQQFKITAKDTGLLVCRGERGKETLEGTVTDINSLYLNTTTYWDDADTYAYKIGSKVDIECKGVYDEFVAYTAATADQITTNGTNGIVSIATKNREGVAENEGNHTTYVNRTAYGQSHQTNACSRYYYDLDQCYSEAKNKTNGYIDTPEELMLWSAYQYADGSIKRYFVRDNGDGDTVFRNDADSSIIGSESADSLASLDMKKYSYYPVDLDVSSMTIQNAKIKFYNENIEKAEADNKSTAKSADNTSQHYMMHCGLFLNHTRDQAESAVNVNNVTFQGTIGKTEFGSGVIFGGRIEGDSADTKLYPINVKLNGITLDGLQVYNCGTSYAPLLMNRIGSYTTLTVNDIKTTSEYKNNKAGSSLIGNVGSETGNQINMTFTKINLPDQKYSAGGIFTHASLLESFQYASDGIAVATYNFYKNEDWNGSDHIHEVTYGKEISDSTEYKGLQKWYFDRDGYGETEGEVYSDNGLRNFSGYLPYVCNQDAKQDYAHEIRVNQRPFGITDGCGTYGHPYKITSEKEMKLLAEYMATGNAQKDWEIRITTDQTTICRGDESGHDAVYQYNGTNWVNEEGEGELDNVVMHRYMLSAYYDIQGSDETSTVTLGSQTFVKESSNTGNTLTLTDFRGFGTEAYPFRGVITCTDKNDPTTIILKGNGTGNGLIAYSYGSVVKDLTISYRNDGLVGKTITYAKNDKSDYYPSAFFGGAIGCIMGGDNIIDNVSVEMDAQWLNLSGGQKYLIQAGGYVGSIAGGGVIFRNMDGKTGLASGNVVGGDPSSDLYVNPYVGRVLDGYAFSEGCSVENTDKNYKINKLDTSDQSCIVTTGDSTEKVTRTNPLQTQVKDAQGLLVLSAIINSGAAAGGDASVTGTNAYRGGTEAYGSYAFGNGLYGKVRNASYDHIGEHESTEDFTVSVSDDRNAPGYSAGGQESQTAAALDAGTNAPYLVKKYANPAAFYIGGNARSVSVVLAGGTYDMSGYGTGYQGISARYLSNALYSAGDGYPLSERVVPWVTSIDGNNSILKVNMSVQEYSDDDFHAASVGGMFNLLRQVPDEVPADQRSTYNMLQNLTIKDSTVSLSYTRSTVSGFGNNNQYIVGVGGFAGSTAGVSVGVKQAITANVRCENVKMNSLNITGPSAAGGLFGNTGRGAGSDTDIGKLIGVNNNTYNNYFGLNLINCQYDNLTISSKYASGGFAGFVDCGANVLISSVKNTTDQAQVIGNSSVITTTDTSVGYAGGVFGYLKTNLEINGAGDSEDCQDVVLKDVSVSAKSYAGGYVGQFENYGNTNTYKMISAVFKKGTVNADGNIGGLLGNSESRVTNSISQCRVENTQLNKENGSRQTGGLIGRLNSSGQLNITGCTVKSVTEYGAYSGGLIGEVVGTVTAADTKVTGTESDKTNLYSTNGASGIYGRLSTDKLLTVERCEISNTLIDTSTWSASAFNGDILYSIGQRAKAAVYDSSAEHVEIKAPYSGGFAGQARGTMTASNLEINDVKITGKNSNNGLSGVLIADAGGKLKNAYVAGISIQNTTLTNKSGKAAYNLYGCANGVSKDGIDAKCYFAFADYTGSALTAGSDTVTAGTKKDVLMDAEATAPYVVTSPKGSLKLIKDGKEQLLYGDGAAWTGTDSFTMNAETIVKEKETPTDGHFAYRNTGVTNFDFASAFSTYNSNQTTKSGTDFPVLEISGGDTTSVSSYLDILTNGGFSAANALNTSTAKHVTVKADVYSNQNSQFVYDASQSSALKVETDSNGQISFTATTDYDNDKDRFVLLTVTFAENGHSYNLMVPVLVRRMLEVDFTATLTHGIHFKSSDYNGLTSHVLDSFDNTITGYLTYVYNSANGKYTDYGWQNYVDAGGDVAQSMDKRIKCNLPAGTRLSLVDCQDQNKTVYYHEIMAEEAANQEILLSNFVNTDNKSFVQKSIGELMGAKAEKNSSGKFIKVDENGKPESGKDDQTYGKPSVRIKGKDGYEYYRLASDGENGAYKITIDEAALKDGNTSTVSENYYLVITVPSGDTNPAFINGGIDTRLNITVPKSMNYLLRDGSTDPQNNSSSTYQISRGYEQTLTESLGDDVQPVKLISAADSVLQVSVKDQITFPNGQAYLKTDQLYQKFVGSLQTNHMVNGELETNTSQFPSVTSGKVHYYVYTENNGIKTYYSYTDGAWSNGTTNKQEVIDGGYTWTSDGGNMELILSTDGTLEHAVSLQGVRDKIKGNDTNASTTFYIEAVLDASLPTAGLDVIPESKLVGGSPEDYTKLQYTSLLSTEEDSLTYSSNRATLNANDTKVKYYRDEPDGVKFTYEADYIDQLGINLLDLGQNVDVDGKYANIDTTAIYDLSAMKNLDNTLRNSTGVRFTLQLLPKNTGTNEEEYSEALSDASNYLEVQLNSPDSGTVAESGGTWSWTISKDTYVEAEQRNLKNNNVFNGTVFTQAVRLKVRIDNTEEAQHFYSNYQVVVNVDILGADGTPVDDTHGNDNIIYTLTKIKPEFVDSTMGN